MVADPHRSSSTRIMGSGQGEPAARDEAQDLPAVSPRKIGEYSVLKVLGEGGMGTVYECRDSALDRCVAVKVLKAEIAAEPEMKARFLREARAMARVSSPHVVAVHAVGESEGAPFIVMERLEGLDLSERLRASGPLSPVELVSVLRDAVAGVAAAAQRGIVHRDVKPANLFVVDGRTKVTDFGLARSMDGSASVTQAGLIVGTPYYMAPELGRGAPASIASDIYALGATAFELLTGRPPFTGATPVQVLAAHLTQPVPRVLDACPNAGPALASIIERMLAKDPVSRFGDYAELDSALRALETGEQLANVSQGAARLAQRAAASLSQPAPDTLASLAPQPTNPALRVSGPQVSIKTRSLAVMMTDIAGYTERTGQQSREESARWLALHEDLLRPILLAFGGTLIKNIGDALLVTFDSPTDAVLCGTAIQDRLFLHNREASAGDRIEVRIAISAGEVRLQRGDIYGEPVNLAARLESIGERGEVLITDAVYSTMNTAEVTLEPRGVQTFKGIQRQVQVYAATPDITPGSLPFGGRALARAQSSRPLADVRRSITNGLVGLGRRASDVARRIGAGFRRLPKKAKIAVSATVAVLLVAIGVVYLAAGPETTRGSTQKSVPASEFAALFEQLDEQDAETAKRRLASFKGSDVDEELKKLTRSGSWWQRHHALAVLEARNVSIDLERFAIQDLEEGSNCPRRRMGLMLLKRVGASDRALDAVQTASRQLPDNACMIFDSSSAESAIRARLKKARAGQSDQPVQ